MISYWEKKYWFPRYDFIVVGSGIVGLCSALGIKEKHPKANVAIVERGTIPNGASTKNAGFACFGTVGELLDDLKYQSEDEVLETITMRWEGLKNLRKLVPDEIMQYQNDGGYEYVTDRGLFDEYNANLGMINEIMQEACHEREIIQVTEQSNSTSFYSGCFFNRFEAKLNPAKMVNFLTEKALNSGVRIIYSFEMQSYEKSSEIHLMAKNGMQISCDHLIICTNAFTNSIIEGMDIIPARNHVILTETIENLKYKGCYHYDRGYVYFRDLDGRLLIGGARNADLDTESTIENAFNEKILTSLRQFMVRLGLSAETKIEYKWTGIIATGKSKKPIVKEIDSGIYTAVRLGGMGVAIGSGLAGRLMELIE